MSTITIVAREGCATSRISTDAGSKGRGMALIRRHFGPPPATPPTRKEMIYCEVFDADVLCVSCSVPGARSNTKGDDSIISNGSIAVVELRPVHGRRRAGKVGLLRRAGASTITTRGALRLHGRPYAGLRHVRQKHWQALHVWRRHRT